MPTFSTLSGLLTYNQRINPYQEVGSIHNHGLDDIISNIGDDTVCVLATNYIVANYTTNVTYANQSILPIATKGYNVSIDPQNNLGGIDLEGGFNKLILKVFAFVNNFPPSVSANTVEKSYAIFGDNNSETLDLYQSQFITKTNDILNEILDSDIPEEEKVLPLIAHAVLVSSYLYWQKAYFNAGGSNAWYSYITDALADIKDINWRQTIMQDIKGALVGAVASMKNNCESINGGVVIGAAAAGMSASAQDIVLQVGFTEVFAPKP